MKSDFFYKAAILIIGLALIVIISLWEVLSERKDKEAAYQHGYRAGIEFAKDSLNPSTTVVIPKKQ